MTDERRRHEHQANSTRSLWERRVLNFGKTLVTLDSKADHRHPARRFLPAKQGEMRRIQRSAAFGLGPIALDLNGARSILAAHHVVRSPSGLRLLKLSGPHEPGHGRPHKMVV